MEHKSKYSLHDQRIEINTDRERGTPSLRGEGIVINIYLLKLSTY
jgi:hypothetical protein